MHERMHSPQADPQNDIEELQTFLAQAERGSDADHQFAARIFRHLIAQRRAQIWATGITTQVGAG